jgi:hypothetical protein
VKLYVDDVRGAPEGWTLARDYRHSVLMFQMMTVEELSLDHDLGLGLTGYDIALWMVEYGIWPKHIYCHSMNPVGRGRILRLLRENAPVGVTVHDGLPA